MTDGNPVEKSFNITTSLLFGKPLQPIEKYEEWLFDNMPKRRIVTWKDSGKRLVMANYSIFKFIPDNRIINQESIKEAEARKISVIPTDIHQLGKRASEIALFMGQSEEGDSINNLESNFFNNLNTSYRTLDCFSAKNCGCSIYSSFSENAFGCFLALYSNFVINCYYSTKLSQCFEMDACHNCSRSIFCHNCENVHDSMFCFNAKNLRYAVGNVEIGRERYLQVKKRVLDEIAKKVEANKKLSLTVYNIGCQVRK